MRRPSLRVRVSKRWSLGLLAALLVAPACGAENEEMGGPSPEEPASNDDQVDLEEMLTVVGKADITHGTQSYQAPAGAPRDERGARLFVAFLSGGQEVPPVGTPVEGAMALILNQRQDRLRFVLSHAVEEATVAHLHVGSAGENGPVAVALPSVERLSGGTLKVTAAQVKELLAGRLYVNVHSKRSPAGEIRGQILRPGETAFVAALSGNEEVPPVISSASAQASLLLSPERDLIRYRVTLAGLQPTAAHVHREIAGGNGPVVKPLTLAAGGVLEGSFPVTAEDLQDLARRQWYLNLHSAAHPMGELRGQVVRPGEAVFAAQLTPGQEVPPVAADSTGSAMIVLGSAGSKFLYAVKTSATPTLLHIHRGPGGTNGPVELSLEPVAAATTGILDLGPTRRADVERGLWYVNVHTAANPKGELRGQVLRPGETLYTALVSGAQEVPPTTSTAAGGLAAILNPARTELRYDGLVTGLTPTAAHLHEAPAGMNGPVAFPLTFSSDSTGTALSGQLPVTAEQVAKVDAAAFYMNLHSAANPMGEVRGQLARPGTAAMMPAPTPAITMPPPTPGAGGHNESAPHGH